ncbi:MAG: hypothetical protein N3E37_00560 [Candidatus Micrarchaeota archaeon]|nr:hypothetical protein [Candidatus Micrarchaeota archaeon]
MAVEQLLMLSIGLAIIAIIGYSVWTSANDNSKAAMARNAVDRIASYSDYVYSLEPGSKAVIDVYLPKGIKSINISNKYVIMKVEMSNGITDFFANTLSNQTGYIEPNEGRQTIVIEKLPDSTIFIGENYLVCNPNEINVNLYQGQNANQNIFIKNVGATTINNIQYTLSGQITSLVSLSGFPFSLNQNQQVQKTLFINLPSNILPGTYTGYVKIQGDNPRGTCTISIRINVLSSVSDTQGPVASLPTITPSSPNYTDNIIANATCDDRTTGNSKIRKAEIEIDFSGIWNVMTPLQYSYDTQPILNVSYNLGTLPAGVHYLRVRCTDDKNNIGSPSTLMFVVQGNIVDNTGPVVYDLRRNKSVVNTLDVITINATGDDRNSGNSNISSCHIEIDNSNIWNIMQPVSGNYGESPVLTLGYITGPFTQGNHIIRVRCTDVYGNTGSSAQMSFFVYLPDTQGPEVTFFMTTPNRTTSADFTLITITANDTNRGNSTIANCELRLDNNPTWYYMTPVGETYSNVVQNFTFGAGKLLPGNHVAYVRCRDSQNNLGNVYQFTFNVSAEIAFITNSWTPNSEEQTYINWLYTKSSNETFLWKFDVIPSNNVYQLDHIRNYKVVIMAFSKNSDPNFYPIINQFKNLGKYVILLGQGIEYGIKNLNAGTGNGNSITGTTIRVNSNHYVTNNFNLNTNYQISTSSQCIYYHTAMSGQNIASYFSNSNYVTISNPSYVLTLGTCDASKLNTNGNTLLTRIIDYALLNSN